MHIKNMSKLLHDIEGNKEIINNSEEDDLVELAEMELEELEELQKMKWKKKLKFYLFLKIRMIQRM